MIGKAIFMKEDINRNFVFSGVIENIDNNVVYIYYNKNPQGYRNYRISLENLHKFIDEKLYKIAKATYNQKEYIGE